MTRIAVLRIATASVWLVFGIVFKMLDLVPRHRWIVASVVGEAVARPVTILIGGAEAAMGLWIMSGVRPRVCATAQTLAIVAMNALELTRARDLLLAPIPMICANAAFLTVGWYCAIKASVKQRAS